LLNPIKFAIPVANDVVSSVVVLVRAVSHWDRAGMSLLRHSAGKRSGPNNIPLSIKAADYCRGVNEKLE
jgi:hypothetical protein